MAGVSNAILTRNWLYSQRCWLVPAKSRAGTRICYSVAILAVFAALLARARQKQGGHEKMLFCCDADFGVACYANRHQSGARKPCSVYMALTIGCKSTCNIIDFAHVHFCTLLYCFQRSVICLKLIPAISETSCAYSFALFPLHTTTLAAFAAAKVRLRIL